MKQVMILATALSLGVSGAALAATASTAPAKSYPADTTHASSRHKTTTSKSTRHAKLDCTKDVNKDKAACRR